MSEIEERLARLRNFNALVHRDDPKLAEESADLGGPRAGGYPL